MRLARDHLVSDASPTSNCDRTGLTVARTSRALPELSADRLGIENRPPDNRHLPSHTSSPLVTSAAPDPLAGLPPRYLRTPEAARFLGLSGRALEKHGTYGYGPNLPKGSAAASSMRSKT